MMQSAQHQQKQQQLRPAVAPDAKPGTKTDGVAQLGSTMCTILHVCWLTFRAALNVAVPLCQQLVHQLQALFVLTLHSTRPYISRWPLLDKLLFDRSFLNALFNKLSHRSAADFRIRLLALATFSLLNVVVGASFYKLVTGVPWGQAMFDVYGVLYNAPGADVTSEQTWLGSFVLNLIFIFGLFVFATVLATISDEVSSMMGSIRSGERPLRMLNHVLLLNWNEQAPYILRQIAAAQDTPGHPLAGRPVAILAEEDKTHMDVVISRQLRGTNLEVHTRVGCPYRLDDLRRVSAGDADIVMLLHPERKSGPEAAESLKTQTVMALSTFAAHQQQLVVQMPGHVPSDIHRLRKLSDVLQREGFNFHLVELAAEVIMDSMIAQTSMQPFIATIYRQLLKQAIEPEFSWIKIEEGAAGRYQEVRRLLGTDKIICGFVTGQDNELNLNPKESDMVHVGDLVLALTKEDRFVMTSSQALEASRAVSGSGGSFSAGGGGSFLPSSPSSTTGQLNTAKRLWSTLRDDVARRARSRQEASIDSIRGRRVLVAGVTLRDIRDGLYGNYAQFAPPKSVVTFLVKEMPSEEIQVEVNNNACEFYFVEHSHPTSFEGLIRGGITHAHSLVLGTDSDLAPSEADALILSSMVEVHNTLTLVSRYDDSRPFHVVAKISSTGAAELCRAFFHLVSKPAFTFELVQPYEYESAILTQVAEDPFYNKVVSELLGSADGNEVYVMDLERLGFSPGDRVKFQEVTESARLQDITPIGLITGGDIILVPHTDDYFTFKEDDKLVAFADLW